MQITKHNSLVDIDFSLNWESDGITHQDRYYIHELNLWQDYLPDTVIDQIVGKSAGYKAALDVSTGDLVPKAKEDLQKTIKLSQVDSSRLFSPNHRPGNGRFYPKGIVGGLSGIYKQNVTPLRFIDRNGKTARIDLNHPLAGIDLELYMDVARVVENDRKLGGQSMDWMDVILTGPGMQSRFQNKATEFFSDTAFWRDDVQADALFYNTKRLVSHIDTTAQAVLARIYGGLLKGKAVVLDLMASWQSHLPKELEGIRLEGLGMNQHELLQNRRLSDYIVHDLNQHPKLPYPTNRFDAVICSLSVEYLTQPFMVFNDVARVLKPGGTFIVSFSNRWFPTKSIEVWKHLHEFERLALVTEYFLHSGCFENIQTISQRGYPRPYTDQYFPAKKEADPIYVVSGTCI